jgi:acyl carrier protein
VSDLEDRLRKAIAKALDRNVDPGSIKGDNLIDELHLSSVDALEVLIWVETEFGIEIADEDLNRTLVESLPALADYVRSRMTSQPEAGR